MRRLGLVGYAVSALLALAMAAALFGITSEAARSADRVDHTLQVLNEISGIDRSLARAEAAQRGYLLYNEDRFMHERDAEMEGTRAHATRVAELTADNPSQQGRLRELQSLLAERLERMHRNVIERRGRPNSGGRGVGGQLRARIEGLTGELRKQELQALQARRAEQATLARQTRYVLAGTVFLFMALIIPGYAVFLRESRARRRVERSMLDLAESLPGAVFQFRSFPDGSGRYELLTSATENLRGVNRAAAIRDPNVMLDTIVEPDRQQFMRALDHHARTLKPLVFDYRARVNGQVRWIRSTSAPQRGADGTILWSGHWDDVTSQRELEGELLRSKEAADAANRAKSTFLATMSHEIRTPMNGVLGMLDLLALSRLDPEQRNSVAVVNESARSLLRIIDDILDFSKIEAGKLELRSEPTSIREVVERVWNTYSGTASSKGLLLTRHCDAGISPSVIADPLRLQQVLNNFVSNAIKFTHAGQVSIVATLVSRAEGVDTVRLAVEDTGIGLTQEQQLKLFQPFVQASDDTALRYGGTGLGLSICRRLAELMGGEIGMESEHGRGTRMEFIVSLPVADLVPSASSERAVRGDTRVDLAAASAPPGEELILVVDDHPVNRLVLERQVNALGYAAESAENGLEAMEKWSTGRFAAIITDCNMPDMSGYQLARDVRACEARHGHARTPIIACTANALGGEAEKCFAAGMDDYLSKPVQIAALAQKLARWVQPQAAAPQSSANDPEAPLDDGMLQDISGGDSAIARDLLARFHRYNAEDARKLRAAVQGNDCEQASLFCHRIKGSSRTIGANRLAEVCERLEHAARAGDVIAMASHLAAFEQETRRLEAFIRARVAA